MLQVGHPCGLFNRVDVIVTGYVLAKMRGEDEIEVLWPLNDRHMPIAFAYLFTGLPRGRVVEQEIDDRVSDAYARAVAALPGNYRDSQIYTDVLRRLLANVVPEVQSAVDAFVDRHFGNAGEQSAGTIGLHIRRSEAPLPLCPYAQPLRYYEAVIRSFPEETRFLVSTDSPDAFAWMHARFGDRVFQRAKISNDRVSIAGVREGLIDMLLLSKCDALIGTYGSSFSGQAALASRRPLLMVKTLPEIPDDWPSFSRVRWLWAYRHFLVESTIWRRTWIWVVQPQLARIPNIPRRMLRRIRTTVNAGGA